MLAFPGYGDLNESVVQTFPAMPRMCHQNAALVFEAVNYSWGKPRLFGIQRPLFEGKVQ